MSDNMNDFLKSWLPILLSLAAILVTCYTVYKQNKIVLFKNRYKVLSVLGYLLSVTQIILKENISSKNFILYNSMDTYCNTTTLNDTVSKGEDISSFYTGLIFEAGKAKHLFKKKHTADIMRFLTIFNEIVLSNDDKNIYEEKFEELRQIYSKLQKDNAYGKLEQYLDLYK